MYTRFRPHPRFHLHLATFALVTAFGVGTAGCASAPLRTEASTSGIRAAEELQADKVPQASLHLQLAREELEHAKKLGKSDEQQGASMLLRSEADAQLAVILAREETEKEEARAALKRVEELRKENPMQADENNSSN